MCTAWPLSCQGRGIPSITRAADLYIVPGAEVHPGFSRYPQQVDIPRLFPQLLHALGIQLLGSIPCWRHVTARWEPSQHCLCQVEFSDGTLQQPQAAPSERWCDGTSLMQRAGETDSSGASCAAMLSLWQDSTMGDIPSMQQASIASVKSNATPPPHLSMGAASMCPSGCMSQLQCRLGACTSCGKVLRQEGCHWHLEQRRRPAVHPFRSDHPQTCQASPDHTQGPCHHRC